MLVLGFNGGTNLVHEDIFDLDAGMDFQARAVKQGRKAQELALEVLVECGFVDIDPKRKYSDLGVEVNFLAHDEDDAVWLFDVSGAFNEAVSTSRSALTVTPSEKIRSNFCSPPFFAS